MKPVVVGATLVAACMVVAFAALAQPSKDPLVFIWLADKEKPGITAKPSGSGFLLGQGGYVVTARHVVDHNPFEVLRLSIGSKSNPRVPVFDDIQCVDPYDLCIVRVLAEDVAQAKIAPVDFYRVRCRSLQGEEALSAYGFLVGDSGIDTSAGKVSTGMVEDGVVLTGMPLEPSMSGGPVFDAEGQVVAIVNGAATHQGAIVPLVTASLAISSTGYDCQSGWPQRIVELRDAEVKELKAMNRAVSVALQTKRSLLVPALDAYAESPGPGKWKSVQKAAEVDAERVDAAVTSAIAFLSRYRPGGSEDVDMMLNAGFDAPPDPVTRPEMGSLEGVVATLAGKTGVIQEIRDEPVPPDPAKALDYRRQMTDFVADIEQNFRGLTAAYVAWLHPE